MIIIDLFLVEDYHSPVSLAWSKKAMDYMNEVAAKNCSRSVTLRGRSHYKKYQFEAQLAFLIMSFFICMIAFTVQYDIWPFLQKTLPFRYFLISEFTIGVIVSLLLPLIWLWFDWKQEAIRYCLLSFMVMLALQFITEFFVGNIFFVSMVIPTAMLYVSYRLIQLINLQRLMFNTPYPNWQQKLARTAVIVLNFLFWGFFWAKLLFFVFPKIIEIIF